MLRRAVASGQHRVTAGEDNCCSSTKCYNSHSEKSDDSRTAFIVLDQCRRRYAEAKERRFSVVAPWNRRTSC